MFESNTLSRPAAVRSDAPRPLDTAAAPWRRPERAERKLPELERLAADAVLSRAELQALVAEMLG